MIVNQFMTKFYLYFTKGFYLLKVHFVISILLLLASCVSYPKVISDPDSSDESKMIEAEVILSKPFLYKLKNGTQKDIIDLLSFYPKPTEPPTPIDDKKLAMLSDYEKEKIYEDFEDRRKTYLEKTKKDALESAMVRSVAIRLLAERPTKEIFDLILTMLADNEEIVRDEAKKVVNRATFNMIDTITNFTINSVLQTDVKIFLVDKIASFGKKSERYVINLLDITDLEIRSYVVSILNKYYPAYHNDAVKTLITSSDINKRVNGAFWLGQYISREGLIETLNLMEDNEVLVKEEAINSFNNYGSWTIPDLVRFLYNNLYPKQRLLIIKKVASFRDERIIPYLQELIEEPDTDSFELGYLVIKYFGIRYEPYFNQLFISKNDKVREAGLGIASQYVSRSNKLLEQITILLADKNPTIRANTYNLIDSLFKKNEVLLSDVYNNSSNPKVKNSLLQIILKHGAIKFLQDDKGKFVASKLFYLMQWISNEQWQAYIEKIKSSKNQIYLQSYYDFYHAVVNYNKVVVEFESLPNFDDIKKMVALQADINKILANYKSSSEEQNLLASKKRNLAKLKQVFIANYSSQSEKIKYQYKKYKDINYDTVRKYNYVDKSDIDIVNYIASRLKFDYGYCSSFIDLQLF